MAATGSERKGRFRDVLGLVCFSAAAVALAAYLHLSLPNIPDRDALYHYGHAALYRDEGPLVHAFPWTAYSMVAKVGADIWYGFHLLLVPFTLSSDQVRGVKLAGAFDLAAMLVLVFAAVRVLRMRLAPLWPLAALCFSPYLLYRFVMTRPHVISTGLAALLLAVAVEGSLWGVGLVSCAITFVHLGFFWVIPLIVGVVLFTKWATEGRPDWRGLVAAAAGGALGWALRPNPIGAAKLVYIQIVQLALEKHKGVPLLFGADLMSGVQAIALSPDSLTGHLLAPLALWALSAAVLIAAVTSRCELSPRQRTLLWGSLALSALTLGMMMQVSVRAIDLLSVFTVMLAASVYTLVLAPGIAGRTPFSTPATLRTVAALGGVLIAFMVWRGASEHARVMPKLGYSATRFRAAAQWLAANSQPGDIVFQAHWDLFPDLFFWNRKDFYVGGMDPIFQYAYSPALYWEAHHLYGGRFSNYTCSDASCGPWNGKDTFTVLSRDFGAEFLVLERPGGPMQEQGRHAALFQYAVNDPRFQFVFDDGQAAVFRLVGSEPSRPR